MRKVKLLPYIREDVFGLDTKTGQFYGWEIQKFEIQKYWKYSMGEGITVAVIDTGGCVAGWSGRIAGVARGSIDRSIT